MGNVLRKYRSQMASDKTAIICHNVGSLPFEIYGNPVWKLKLNTFNQIYCVQLADISPSVPLGEGFTIEETRQIITIQPNIYFNDFSRAKQIMLSNVKLTSFHCIIQCSRRILFLL